MIKALLPVVGLLARMFAPRLLDWIAANRAIPSWLKPVITEVLTAVLAAVTATTAMQAARPRRARKVRAGLRKALS